MNRYLDRHREVQDLFLDGLGMPAVEPAFADYLSQIARGYSAKDIKRFQDERRYALMACFLHESRKVVLDHLVEMHDKFMLNMCRDAKSAHETQYRALRKRQKAAIDAVLRATTDLLDWPQDEPRTRDDFWGQEDEQRLRDSITDLKVFQRLEERGYGDRLLARYPSLRKYFAEFCPIALRGREGQRTVARGDQPCPQTRRRRTQEPAKRCSLGVRTRRAPSRSARSSIRGSQSERLGNRTCTCDPRRLPVWGSLSPGEQTARPPGLGPVADRLPVG